MYNLENDTFISKGWANFKIPVINLRSKNEANLAEKSIFQKFIALELVGADSSYFGNLHYL